MGIGVVFNLNLWLVCLLIIVKVWLLKVIVRCLCKLICFVYWNESSLLNLVLKLLCISIVLVIIIGV